MLKTRWRLLKRGNRLESLPPRKTLRMSICPCTIRNHLGHQQTKGVQPYRSTTGGILIPLVNASLVIRVYCSHIGEYNRCAPRWDCAVLAWFYDAVTWIGQCRPTPCALKSIPVQEKRFFPSNAESSLVVSPHWRVVGANATVIE